MRCALAFGKVEILSFASYGTKKDTFFWQSSGHKSKTREWIDAIVFAVIAATIIRTFFIEAFTIPTPSMEEKLMVGDFLFVSKLNYGARTPMTPLSFPFVHQELPVIGGKLIQKHGNFRITGYPDSHQ